MSDEHKIEALAEQPAGAVGESWRPMETAPRDGTMLRLLVEFEDHATEDSAGPSPTIGANAFDGTGEDAWQFAGWCWTHDHFTEGKGTPVGWLPILSDIAPRSLPLAYVCGGEVAGFQRGEFDLATHRIKTPRFDTPIYTTPPAASVDVEAERQRFEAWINTEVHPITTVEQASGKAGDKRYLSPTTAIAWLAWQAAQADSAGGAKADCECGNPYCKKCGAFGESTPQPDGGAVLARLEAAERANEALRIDLAEAHNVRRQVQAKSRELKAALTPQPDGGEIDMHEANGLLCEFAMRWKLDGDYIRCKGCNRPQLTSYADHPFQHANGCKQSATAEAYPWRTFVGLLAPLYTRPSAAAAVPGSMALYSTGGVNNIHDYLIDGTVKAAHYEYAAGWNDYRKAMLAAAPAAPKGGVVELPAKWRQDASADHVLPTSLWDQGYAYGRTECADELTAALANPEQQS